MSMIEFRPCVAPSPGAQNKPAIKILQADFGDGYSQPTPDGLNHIRRVLTLQWDGLDWFERDQIIDFLECRGGTEPFIFRMPEQCPWYIEPKEVQAKFAYTCADWSDTALDGGFYTINATFKRWFGAVA
jgi:phage-related protein